MCQAINKEAIGVLYGHNLVEVRVYTNCVHVHGTPYDGHVDGSLYKRFTPLSLEWPDYLRRVQWLHVVNTGEWDGLRAHTAQASEPITTFHRVLYSICCHLKESHSLRAMHVIYSHQGQPGNVQPWGAAAQNSLADPLRMLGTLKQVVVELNGVKQESFITTRKGVNELIGIELVKYLPIVLQAKEDMKDIIGLVNEVKARYDRAHGLFLKERAREWAQRSDRFPAFDEADGHVLNHPLYRQMQKIDSLLASQTLCDEVWEQQVVACAQMIEILMRRKEWTPVWCEIDQRERR